MSSSPRRHFRLGQYAARQLGRDRGGDEPHTDAFRPAGLGHEEVKANCTRSARESFPNGSATVGRTACDVYYALFRPRCARRINLTPANGADELLNWLREQEIPALHRQQQNRRLSAPARRRSSAGINISPPLSAPRCAARQARARTCRSCAALAGLEGGSRYLVRWRQRSRHGLCP